jgi:hypothetical protein
MNTGTFKDGNNVWQNSYGSLPFNTIKTKQGGVSHCGIAIYITKYLKAKEERIMETLYGFQLFLFHVIT